MLPHPEPPHRSAQIAQLSGAKQTTSEGSAKENNLQQHTHRATLSWQVDDSTNESFATAPKEPSDVEMAFHIRINMMTAAVAHNTSGNPQSISEAQSHPDWPEWQQAMEHEIDTLKHAGTWETVACPENKNIVGSKWVFQLKCKADGSIDKYKAHLVAWGFTQVYSVNYFDIFSPVTKITSIWVILVIAV
jgi:Reverse transcriptase (RNA-dependent DNA polymerase)